MAFISAEQRSRISAYVGAALLSMLTCRVLMAIHSGSVDNLANASFGVTRGQPEWLAFQNRLLGPYLVLWISKAGTSYQTAWKIFTMAATFAEGVLVFWLLRRRPVGASRPIVFLVMFLFAFLALQHYWLYTWDSIDLIVFTLFGYCVVFDVGWKASLLLFPIALANRESAVFIAVFIIVDAIGWNEAGRRSVFVRDRTKFVVGCILAVLAMLYTKWVRSALFVGRPDGTGDADHQAIGNHIYLLGNLRAAFLDNFVSVRIMNTIALGILVVYCASIFRTANRAEKTGLIMSGIILLNVFVFGLVNETRCYFVLLPFLFFLWVADQERKSGLAAAGFSGQSRPLISPLKP